MIRYLQFLVALAFAACTPATTVRAGDLLVVGYVDIADDPRHTNLTASGGIVLRTRGHPLDGAKVAMGDLAAIGRALNVEFSLVTARAGGLAAFVDTVTKLRNDSGARMIFLDGPAAAIRATADAIDGRDALLFNVSAEDDELRGRACSAHLMHLIPSLAMRTDAIAQFLVARRWRNVLALEGESLADAAFVSAFERSAKRFGARIVERRKLAFGRDPRLRDQNNLMLLTGGVSYDAILVADETEEVGRYLPYQTQLPRPIVGSAGLMATAWHFAWEHNGGPQLSLRFRRSAHRDMRSVDWAAWVGIRAIAEAVTRIKSTEFVAVASYLRSEALRIDGFKGPALSFRAWDNQLRQPIFLATDLAVIDRAPMRQFIHATQNLDTLGHERSESACRLNQ